MQVEVAVEEVVEVGVEVGVVTGVTPPSRATAPPHVMSRRMRRSRTGSTSPPTPVHTRTAMAVHVAATDELQVRRQWVG
jgi:hypothetical protein